MSNIVNFNQNLNEKFEGTIVRTSNYNKNIRPFNRFFHILGNIYNIKTNELIEKNASIIAFCRDCNQLSFKNAFNINFDKNWYSFPLNGEKVKGLISRKFQSDNPHKIDARPQGLLIEWCENQIPLDNTKLIKRTIGENPQYHIAYNDSYGIYFDNKKNMNSFLQKLNITSEEKLIQYINITTLLQKNIFNLPNILENISSKIKNKDCIDNKVKELENKPDITS